MASDLPELPVLAQTGRRRVASKEVVGYSPGTQSRWEMVLGPERGTQPGPLPGPPPPGRPGNRKGCPAFPQPPQLPDALLGLWLVFNWMRTEGKGDCTI